MKNMKKFAAGFIAAAMAMTMSLSAFADVVAPTISTDKLTLNLNTGITTVNGDQTTMMAYVVPGIITDTKLAPDYTGAEGQEIVALDQVDGKTGITSVPVDAKKLIDGNTIVVKISGTDGNLATYLIAMEAPATTYSVTYELAGGTVSTPGAQTFDADDTIAAFVGALEVPEKVDDTGAYTYTFSRWALTADGDDVTKLEGKTKMVDLLEGDATSVTLYAIYDATPKAPVVETFTVIIGDIDRNNSINANDVAMLAQIVAAGRNNTKVNQIKADWAATGATVYAKEVYVLADASGNVTIGDIDLNNSINANDVAMLAQIVAAGRNNTKVNQIKADWAATGATVYAKDTRVVNEK